MQLARQLFPLSQGFILSVKGASNIALTEISRERTRDTEYKHLLQSHVRQGQNPAAAIASHFLDVSHVPEP